jgi:riboflavin kinase/FMN adenylyltransferase
MVNLGPRPTFGETARLLEAHLLGFDGDLYGQEVQVEFVRRLRDIQRFDSAQELEAQLGRDRAAALDALRTGPGPVSF